MQLWSFRYVYIQAPYLGNNVFCDVMLWVGTYVYELPSNANRCILLLILHLVLVEIDCGAIPTDNSQKLFCYERRNSILMWINFTSSSEWSTQELVELLDVRYKKQGVGSAWGFSRKTVRCVNGEFNSYAFMICCPMNKWSSNKNRHWYARSDRIGKQVQWFGNRVIVSGLHAFYPPMAYYYSICNK